VFMLNTDATTGVSPHANLNPVLAKLNPSLYLYVICVVTNDYYDLVTPFHPKGHERARSIAMRLARLICYAREVGVQS
jgi:hypothetical protein